MRRLIALLLVVGSTLAGCTAPQEAEALPPDDPAPTPERPRGFVVEGLRIAHEGATDAPLHEDEAAVARYTLRHPGGGTASATFFVSFILDGKVVDVQPLTLAPDEAKDQERALPPLWGRERVSVEVRAGAERTTTEAAVLTWPRTGERVDLGPVALQVNRWLKNATTGWIDVNVTADRKPDPDGTYRMLRAHTLCLDGSDRVSKHGEARPHVPEPGASAMTDIHLPPCDHALYGVEFTGEDAAGGPLRTRILFVEHGWRPQDAS